jgi:nucleoside-diphosphate-sugar epimerase
VAPDGAVRWDTTMGDILILGGTAWFGRTLAERALTAGHRVTCLARGSRQAPPDGCRFVPSDRDQPDAYADVTDTQWDLVVEIAWQPGMVQRALDALAARARGWVMISSCSAYADHDRPGADETAALLPAASGEHVDLEEYGGAKVACEQLTAAATDGRAVLARAGLIGGDGDLSDRTGYWPGRFALAGGGPVLVPADGSGSVQIIDVRDLADFVLLVGLAGRSGPVNVVGQRTSLADTLRLASEAAVAAGYPAAQQIPAQGSFLQDRQVNPWAGPRSLPLWLPDEGYAGFGAHSDRLSLDWGLTRRPLADTLSGALQYEIRQGLDRPRRAGLTREEELDLTGQLAATGAGAGT